MAHTAEGGTGRESDIWRPWDRKMEGSGEVSVIDMESLRQRGCQRELTVVDHLRGWRKTSHRERKTAKMANVIRTKNSINGM